MANRGTKTSCETIGMNHILIVTIRSRGNPKEILKMTHTIFNDSRGVNHL